MFKAIASVVGAGMAAAVVLALRPAASEVNQVTRLAPDVFFHEGDLQRQGHCNNGWIVFDDYVLVVDANFPSGAETVLPKIKAVTSKPVRFAFDTHHHGDHAYGNQVWVDQGAVPVAHTGVLEEMKKYETGYFGGKPGRWEDTAKTRKDVAASRLKPPTLLFPNQLFFEDGKHRVELVHLGVAHTHGDGFAWLPNEKILFTGDACVNGPYNYVGDGSVKAWIRTLDAAKKLGAKTVVPGHGPVGDASLLEDQRQFFRTLQSEVETLKSRYGTPGEVKAHVDEVRQSLLKRDRIKRYVGDSLAAQVEKVYTELGGQPFPMSALALQRRLHARDHRLRLLELGPPLEWERKLAQAPR